MKLKKRLKSVADITRAPSKSGQRRSSSSSSKPRASGADTWEKYMRDLEERQREREREAEIASIDPVAARQVNRAYTGPEMPDKGMKDGSCNRTACQMPLKGKRQFWMKNLMVHEGRNYYCADCARLFDEQDASDLTRGFHKPGDYGFHANGYRCAPDEDNDKVQER